jgi:methylenetetrahydrofolate reductase (NADPH)
MTTTKSKLGEALTSSRLVITAECLPPRTGGADAVKQLAALLPSKLDAVVVADNPEKIGGSALACASLLVREGITTVLSMVTRDRNRIALESDALGAAALGIDGILCLSGHHQSLGVSPQAAGVYDIDSIQLTQMVKSWGIAEMLVGAAAHPYQQPIGLTMLRLKKKIAAGADFLLTEAVTDLPAFMRWMEAVRAAGLDQKTAILAGVQPGEGAAKLAAQLKTVPGVRGIHLLSGGCEAQAAGVIQAAGLA